MGTLTSCNPVGHSRPVTGLLYLLPLPYKIQSPRPPGASNGSTMSFM